MRKMKKIMLLLLILIVPMSCIKFVDNYFGERTNLYVIKQADNMASNAVKDIIMMTVVPRIDMEKILIFKYLENNQIDTVIVNTKIVNEIMGEASEIVDMLLSEEYLDDTLNELSLPLGFVISPALFASSGPKIKIKIRPIGSYSADVITDVSSFGINNSLIEVYLQIRIDIEALIPLQQKNFKSETKVYLVSQVIQGTVPKYYYGTGANIDYIPDNEGDSSDS